MNDITFDYLSFTSILQTKMPDEIVNGMNEYLDELRKQEFRESAHLKLVGEIHDGEQLNFDKFDDIRKNVKDIFEKNNFEIQSNAGIIFSAKKEHPFHLIAPLNATDEYYDVLNTTLTNLK